MDFLKDLPNEKRNELPGPSHEEVNCAFWAIAAALTILLGSGLVFDSLCFTSDGQKRSKLWLAAVLFGSYLLLVPGMCFNLISFNIFAHVNELIFTFNYNFTRAPVSESMWSLVHTLWRTGGRMGAVCIVLFAMVMPAVKLYFLFMGNHWRDSDDAFRRRVARRCILIVKTISKWACPDMFAYILLTFLFRDLNEPPLIQSQADLGLGFVCFSIFCISSTFSTLAVHEPEQLDKPVSTQQSDPLHRSFIIVVGLLSFICVCLLHIGVVTPCMALRVNTDAILQPTGPVPRTMESFVNKFDLPGKLNADVSVWTCTWALAHWALGGEGVFMIAFSLIAIFVVAIPIFDLAAALLATWYVCVQRSSITAARARTALATSQFLNHVGMLDVFCTGVVVVTLAGDAYRSVGFELSMMRGIIPLICAEIVHSATYHLVFYKVAPLAQCSEFMEVGISEGDSEIALVSRT